MPVVLGFEPADSLVLLTFGGRHTFHARVDLPTPSPTDGLDAAGDDLDLDLDLADVAHALLAPALRHRVATVVVVVYTDDEHLGARAAATVQETFGAAGIAVAHVLRADGLRWWPDPAGVAPGTPGVPYDLGTHPFRVESVLGGVVTHPSRAALAATLATDPCGTRAVVAALAGLAPGDVCDVDAVRALLARHVGAGTRASDEEVAALVLGLQDPDVRDAAWSGMRRAGAGDHVQFWSDVVRRVPDPLVAAPAAVLAVAAWLAGHGALAWCAVDRATAADPRCTLARLVGDALESAVPPAQWDAFLERGAATP